MILEKLTISMYAIRVSDTTSKSDDVIICNIYENQPIGVKKDDIVDLIQSQSRENNILVSIFCIADNSDNEALLSSPSQERL